MNETENAVPTDFKQQKMNTSTSSITDTSKRTRTPFKDIGNNPSVPKSPLKDKVATSSANFDAISALDDEENWRERTEVVTKLEHTAYKVYAREVIEETIKKLPVVTSNVDGTPVQTNLTRMTFRDTAIRSLDDSVLSLNGTISSPSLDLDTTVLKRNIPVANSTLNVTRSNPSTPNKSDVLENSLLGSFEKMQIKMKEYDEDDEEIFHDASDEFDTFSATPSKAEATEITQKGPDDPFDMLLNHLEKFTVVDNKDLSVREVCSPVHAPIYESTVNRSASEKMEESNTKCLVMNPKVGDGESQEHQGIKGDFKDPEYNPFLSSVTKEATKDEADTPTSSLSEEVIRQTKSNSTDDVKEINTPVPSTSISDVSITATEKSDEKCPLIVSEKERSDLVETVPPTKRSNFETILDKIDNATFDPFASKSNVSNSPMVVEKNNPISSHVSTLSNINSVCDPEDKISPQKDNNLKNAFDTLSTFKKVTNPETYEVKFDPLEEIAKSPCKEKPTMDLIVSPKRKYEEAFVDEPQDDLLVGETAALLDVAVEQNVVNQGETTLENESATVPEEIIPPTKAYDLDFLNALDDTSYNPFASKASVTNSPDKSNASMETKSKGTERIVPNCKTEIKGSDSLSATPTHTSKEIEKKTLAVSDDAVKQKVANQEETVLTKLENNPVPAVLEEEEIIPPTKAYDLDFLDALDDTKFNPFATKASVANSPGKDDASVETKSKGTDKTVPNCKTETKGSDSLSATPTHTSKEIEKETLAVSDDAVKQKANQEETILTKLENNPVPTVLEEEEIIPPTKAYDLDFLDALDDTKFNPFATKASVANSPGKDDASMETKSKGTDKTVPNCKTEIKGNGSLPAATPIRSSKQVGKIVSPKRTYDEAFVIGEPQDDLLVGETTALSDGAVVQNVANQEETTLENESATVPGEEEIIPPTKAYDLDFLDALDDTKFNPFATKASVANSPDKSDASMETILKDTDKTLPICKTVIKENGSLTAAMPTHMSKANKEVEKNVCEDRNGEQPVVARESKDDFVKKATEISNCMDDSKIQKKMTDETATKKETLAVSDDAVKQKVANQEETVLTKLEDNPVTAVSEEEEIIPPSKAYDLDFLDALDDTKFNPFATKASVANSPDKSDNKMESELIAGSTAPKSKMMTKENVSLPVQPNQQTSIACNQIEKNVGEDKDDEKHAVAEESKDNIRKEVAGVDCMDESKAQKETANNPGKGSCALQKSKHENPLTKESVAVNHEEIETCEDEEIEVPKKGYQLDFLDNIDDPNLNPFASKASVSNSPEKDTNVKPSLPDDSVEISELTIKEKEQNQSTTESSQSKQCDQSTDDKKPKVVKKKTKLMLKKKVPQMSKTKVDESETKADDEQVIIVPQKSYNLDFLDNLDNSNFNPFSTKAAVSNSPKKEDTGMTANDTEQMCEKETPNATQGIDLEVIDMATLRTEENTTDEPDSQSKLEAIKKSEICISTATQKLPQSQSDVLADVKKSEEQDVKPFEANRNATLALDNLDDPDFNPFVSKCKVSNSPERSASQDLKKETIQEVKVAQTEMNPPTAVTCPPPTAVTCPPPVDDNFDLITKEAMRLVSEVTPSKRRASSRKSLQGSSQAKQKNQDIMGAMDFEDFMDAGEFFSGPGDLDELSEHGIDGDKRNLVRNSLYVKFDPLVSNRQSLAPLLQQSIIAKDNPDPRRNSALMCFSPPPNKTLLGMASRDVTMKPLIKMRADETVLDVTNFTMNETTVCEGQNATVVSAAQNATVVSASSAPAASFNTTIISQGGRLHDETVFQDNVAAGEKMIPEHEVNRIVEELKTSKLILQDQMMRQSRVLEEKQKMMAKQAAESEIVFAGMEEENESLRGKLQQMQAMMVKVVEQVKEQKKEHEKQMTLMENKYELKCSALEKEGQQHQEELKKMEVPFYDLVNKYRRLQEVCEVLRKNEEVLKLEVSSSEEKFAKKKEKFYTILKTMEEKFTAKSQEDHEEIRHKYEHENNKLMLLVKKAEVKILSLNDMLEKKEQDNQRLTKLIDDITNNFS